MTVRRGVVSAPLAVLLTLGCSRVDTSGKKLCFDATPVNHRSIPVACAVNIGDCTEDSDCSFSDGGQRVCNCAPYGMHDWTGGNQCLGGDCLVDSDCACGYCSPSEGTHCAGRGFVGYYCHTEADTCINDSDCDAGYCEFNPLVNHWFCPRNSICTG